MAGFLPLFAIAGALTLGAMSPGPSFVMVARTAVARSRANGLAAALGMGVGGLIYAVASLLGLQALFAAVRCWESSSSPPPTRREAQGNQSVRAITSRMISFEPP